MLSNNSCPSKVWLTANVESSTSISTAKMSSTIRIPNTTPANCLLRNPISSKALKIIVVDDIESIAPRKIQFIRSNPIAVPTKYPVVIIPINTVIAPTIAVPPTFISFLMLKSRPRLNSRKMTPISPQVLMLTVSDTVGMN